MRHPTRHILTWNSSGTLLFHQIFSVQFIFCYESSSVDCILIVGLTFVVAGVFWHCRIDFHFAFESIFSKSPLSYLKYQMIISFPSPLRRKILILKTFEFAVTVYLIVYLPLEYSRPHAHNQNMSLAQVHLSAILC